MTRLRCILLIVMLFPLQSCALYYSAAPIEASVVDAESGKPLEGVIVTANWQLKGGLEGGNEVGQMIVMETVTDKNGRFYFPAWGPKRNISDGHIKSDGPRLLFFKSNYRYVVLFNKISVTDRPGPFLKSDWDGKMIKLEKFKGGAGEYAKHLEFLSSNLYSLLGSEACDWKQVPRMLLALSEQSRDFRKQGIEALYDVYLYLPISEKKCGSAKAFFEGYRP